MTKKQIVVVAIVVAIVLVFVSVAYFEHWIDLGWLQLIIVLFVLVISALCLNFILKNREEKWLANMRDTIATLSMPQQPDRNSLASVLQQSDPKRPKGTEPDLDLWRLMLLFVLVIGSIGGVTSLTFYFGSATTVSPLVTAGISAIVGLVSFLVGHTAASVGKEKSEQRIMNASQQQASQQKDSGPKTDPSSGSPQ